MPIIIDLNNKVWRNNKPSAKGEKARKKNPTAVSNSIIGYNSDLLI